MTTLTKILSPLLTLFARKPYSVIPVNDSVTDVRIVHVTGVTILIGKDGKVTITTPATMDINAVGDMKISSDTHIGLSAPRIDLN